MERTDDEEFDKMMDHILEDLDELGDAETDEISPGVRALFRALSEGSAKANEEYAKQSLMVNSGAIAMFRRIIRFFKSIPMENGGNAELVGSNMKPQLTPNSLEFRVPYLLLSGDSLKEFADIMEKTHDVEVMPGLDGMVHLTFNIKKLWIPIIGEDGGQSLES